MVNLHWIILAPLLGVIVNGLWVLIAARCQREPRRLPIAIIGTAAAFTSFAFSWVMFRRLLSRPEENRLIIEKLFDWIQVGNLNLAVSLHLDPLSAIMILIVTGVGGLIHLYSVGYMQNDEGCGRYFVYLNLFLTAMLILVLAANLPVMFVGWEGVGLCSYLLIGFWFTDNAKASAGKKAFIVNRIGDFGFLLGIFLTFTTLKSLDFIGMREAVGAMPTVSPMLPWIGLLLFLGACGKSAQFPLHIWLPDAMAGPTPVSALIHAATMVTAGVYMIARLSFVYALVPQIGLIVAGVGAFTALFAALIGLVQNDIKKVLAYSTVSQLGYMFLAVGCGGYTAGVFHLMTHAFFKGLLFLGAGSVIHAMSEEQDIQKMGGLAKRIPITFWTFVIAWAAIIGLPPFSGFFSKDEILWQTLQSGHPFLYVVGLSAALLTAFYMSRLVYLTFLGESRANKKIQEHIHESPWTMTVPLILLAVFSLAAGFWGVPHFLSGLFGHNILEKFLEPVFAQAYVYHPEADLAPMPEGLASLLAIVVAASGAGLAYFLYAKSPKTLKNLSEIKPVYNLFANKFYIDELVQKAIVRPVGWFSENGLWKGLDVLIIDGFVNELARFVGFLSAKMKLLQTGQIRVYVFSIAVGVMALLGYIAFLRVW